MVGSANRLAALYEADDARPTARQSARHGSTSPSTLGKLGQPRLLRLQRDARHARDTCRRRAAPRACPPGPAACRRCSPSAPAPESPACPRPRSPRRDRTSRLLHQASDAQGEPPRRGDDGVVAAVASVDQRRNLRRSRRSLRPRVCRIQDGRPVPSRDPYLAAGRLVLSNISSRQLKICGMPGRPPRTASSSLRARVDLEDLAGSIQDAAARPGTARRGRCRRAAPPACHAACATPSPARWPRPRGRSRAPTWRSSRRRCRSPAPWGARSAARSRVMCCQRGLRPCRRRRNPPPGRAAARWPRRC